MGWPRCCFSRVWGRLDNASRINKEEEEEKKRRRKNRGVLLLYYFFSSFFLLLPLFLSGTRVVEGRRAVEETLNSKYRGCEIHVAVGVGHYIHIPQVTRASTPTSLVGRGCSVRHRRPHVSHTHDTCYLGFPLPFGDPDPRRPSFTIK